MLALIGGLTGLVAGIVIGAVIGAVGSFLFLRKNAAIAADAEKVAKQAASVVDTVKKL